MTMLTIFRGAAWLAVAALTIFILYLGKPDQLWWWGTGIPFWLWITGPVWLSYWLVQRYPGRAFALPLGVFFTVSTVVSGLIYYNAFFRSESSTAALAFIFIPLYQWMALLLTLALAGVLR